jgi:hypothetical protein
MLHRDPDCNGTSLVASVVLLWLSGPRHTTRGINEWACALLQLGGSCASTLLFCVFGMTSKVLVVIRTVMGSFFFAVSWGLAVCHVV